MRMYRRLMGGISNRRVGENVKMRDFFSEMLWIATECINEEANRKWTKKDTICSIVSVILSAATSAIVVLLCTK